MLFRSLELVAGHHRAHNDPDAVIRLMTERLESGGWDDAAEMEERIMSIRISCKENPREQFFLKVFLKPHLAGFMQREQQGLPAPPAWWLTK